MSGTIFVRGGFGDESIRAGMSDGLRRRIALAEAEQAQEAAREQRQRALRAEAFEESSLRAAIAAAIEAGEDVSPRRGRHETVGRTRQEAVALFSARQDAEDMQRAARHRVAIRKLMAQHAEQDYGDTSAPTELELTQRAEEQAKRDRDLLRRGRVIQRNQTIRMAREAEAAQDLKYLGRSARSHLERRDN
jgi:hypothetical protein